MSPRLPETAFEGTHVEPVTNDLALELSKWLERFVVEHQRYPSEAEIAALGEAATGRVSAESQRRRLRAHARAKTALIVELYPKPAGLWHVRTYHGCTTVRCDYGIGGHEFDMPYDWTHCPSCGGELTTITRDRSQHPDLAST